MESITSAKNPAVRRLRALRDAKERRAAGRFLVEGEKMIREALSCGLELDEAAAAPGCEAFAEELERAGHRVFMVTREILEAVCETKTPQGVCASFTPPKSLEEDELPARVVALDGVQDPGNLGTIWRTADAAGFQALLLGAGSADPFSPKVQRAAMGSGFRVGCARTDNLPAMLDNLRARGYAIFASDLHGDDFYARPDPGERFVLVIGNEARGISPETREAATALIRLPMRGGAESLNAAVAAGIMMYEMMRGK